MQVGTQHWTEGPRCFDRICGELEGIMTKKGYTSISDFKGKLKEFQKGAPRKKINLGAKNKADKGATGFGVLHAIICFLVAIIAVLLHDKFQ